MKKLLYILHMYSFNKIQIGNSIHLKTLPIHPSSNFFRPSKKTSTVFIDNSRTETGVGAAFCTTEGGVVSPRYPKCSYRVDNKSIFPFTNLWIGLLMFLPRKMIKIYSDSLSSLQINSVSKSTNPQVLEIKIQLKHLLRKSSLGRVSVQKGDLCPLTLRWHIRLPLLILINWLSNILSHPALCSISKQIFSFLYLLLAFYT